MELAPGNTTVKVAVVSEDRKAERVYQVRFRRAGRPGTPAIDTGGVTAGLGSLDVTWTDPASDGGYEIISYDLRYIESSSPNKRDTYWTVLEDAWETAGGNLTTIVEGLIGSTEYDVQVRAFNGSQYSRWSGTVKGTPTASTACSNGAVVPNPGDNAGLVGDCEVLLALESRLAGSGSLNWASTTPIASWTGVTVEGTPTRVATLVIAPSGASGPIPSALGRLGELTELDLFGNEFSGEMPPQLAGLTKLEILNLSDDSEEDAGNELTGNIPSWVIGLTNLETLDLSGNGFTGSIPSLSGLTGLTTLELARNGLTGRIPSLNNLASLETLDLSKNALTGRIDSLHNLASLMVVDLSGNELSGGVPSLDSATVLTTLDLSNNQLAGSIPDTWRVASTTPPNTVKLGALEVLRLDRNQLTGGIPANLNGMTALTELDLGENHLSGSIPSLASLTALTKLYLNDNDLGGVLPTWLTGLTSLVEVDLSGNGLTGEIPSELGDLTGLKVLALSNNQLSGQISGKLAVRTLEKLLLGRNGLSGAIPSEVAALTTLTHLDLSGNRLSGDIPTSWGSPSKLEELLLHDNNLTGPLPTQLASITTLVVLNLGDNDLEGTIPSGWSNQSALEALDLHHNALTGTIPMSLGNLSNLKELSLDENQLSGSIPTQLGSLLNLEELWLSDNQLTGGIPTRLGSLVNLEVLDLHQNGLTGPIPVELGLLTKLEILLLALNDLSGAPPDLGTLSDLEWLYLQYNGFSGEIPEWIEDLEQLSRLYLNENEFEGTIPAWLADLQLSRLYLAGNNLTGCIPGELESLSQDIATDLAVLGLPFCPESSRVRSVARQRGSLTVQLGVPDDPDDIIDYFEVRYIRSDATGKDNDANWTVEQVSTYATNYDGPRSYTITGLTNGVRYDIQTRWVTVYGQYGEWSPTRVGTPGTPPPPPPPPVVEPPAPVTAPPQPNTRRRGGGGGGGGAFVPATLPLAAISTRNLEFTAIVGEGNPPARSLQLWSPAARYMSFNLSGNVPWVSVTPAAGDSTGPQDRMLVTVAVDATELPAGRRQAQLQISGTGFRGSPQRVTVVVTVTSAAFAGTLDPQYDINNNLTIELDEVLAAVRDYFDDRITLESVLAIVKVYFAG